MLLRQVPRYGQGQGMFTRGTQGLLSPKNAPWGSEATPCHPGYLEFHHTHAVFVKRSGSLLHVPLTQKLHTQESAKP